MDVARRCYTAECRFIAGKPPGVIRWYWAKRGARIYPYSTAFGGSQFDRGTGLGYVGPGEVREGLIRFVSGWLQPRQAGLMQTGSQQAFQQGLLEPCDHTPIVPHPQPCRTQCLDSINGV